jgi:hypothetical protein
VLSWAAVTKRKQVTHSVVFFRPLAACRAQQMGLGDVVSSWVGGGANQAIQPEQVGGLLGNDAIQAVASKFGINAAQAGPLIAAVLPTIIDKLTPKGEANDAEHGPDGIQGAVAGLLQGGGLTSILGSLMGGNKA